MESSGKIVVVVGDITKLAVDAIVKRGADSSLNTR